jgi:hypothetical protein
VLPEPPAEPSAPPPPEPPETPGYVAPGYAPPPPPPAEVIVVNPEPDIEEFEPDVPLL